MEINMQSLTEKLKNLTPEEFEDLCVDLLQEEGYELIRKSGRGPDRGMDILIKSTVNFGFDNSEIMVWLIQCKHKSNDDSIKPSDIGDIISAVAKFKANGYLLITNSLPSTSTEDNFYAINSNKDIPIKTSYWDNRILTSKLLQNRSTIQKYLHKENKLKINNKKYVLSNPFRELVAFSTKDSNLFFGRNNEIIDTLERIYRHPNSVLFGESGTGKTSLIKAGLISKLIDEQFIVVYIRCGETPIDSIKLEIIDALRKNGYPYVDFLLATIQFPNFIYSLKHILNDLDLKLIIIIDQFEEIFTRSIEIQRQLLIEGLEENEKINLEKGFLSFLLSLREDYLGKLWELSNKFGYNKLWINTYRIDRLSENNAHCAIEKPLTISGFSIENEVVQKLVSDLKDLGNESIYPPHLQIICYNIVLSAMKEKRNVINFELIEELGNTQEILVKFFDKELFSGLTNIQRSIAENILDSLTGNGGLRSFLTFEELVREVDEKEDELNKILNHLVDKRIVHPIVKNNELIGYELVHDFLSKKFFEKLDVVKKKIKIIIETFRNTMREWNREGMLASSDRLEMFYDFRIELNLRHDEYKMILQSSINSGKYRYWLDEIEENEQKDILKWIIEIGNHERARKGALRILANRFGDYELYELCIKLLKDHNWEIKLIAAKSLGNYGDKDAIPYLEVINYSSYHELNRAVYNAIEKLNS